MKADTTWKTMAVSEGGPQTSGFEPLGLHGQDCEGEGSWPLSLRSLSHWEEDPVSMCDHVRATCVKLSAVKSSEVTESLQENLSHESPPRKTRTGQVLSRWAAPLCTQ